MNLTINGNATLQPGGGFLGDLLGRPGGQGNGLGLGGNSSTAPYYACAGGGYGGKGGNSVSNSATGGTSGNDSAANPSSSYSGSGGGNYSPSSGGSGGGFFQFFVTGTLQHDGLITANGGNGSGPGGGGGSGGATGGMTNGAAARPTDFGSGGGTGASANPGGSAGGGAIRISVGGTLNLDGTLSANGDAGQQDNSGGGAGGSLWISANTLTGLGTISVAGGNGDLWNGGGGGGGRIAIYSPTNLFAGVTNLTGGVGAMNGQPGTLFLAAVPVDFLIGAQSPTGTVANTVSYVDLFFNEAVDPASVSAAAFTLTTPAGVMATANLSAAPLDWAPSAVRVSFPLQNLLGNYSLQVAPFITNILGQPLAQSFTGNFTITLPTISGTVNDTNGAPVAGVLVQPGQGLIGATTDTNGVYSIGVPSGWVGTLTPFLGTNVFVPGTLSFYNVGSSLTNQNFLMVTSIAPDISSSLSGTNLSIGWSGISGVTYQAWSSTNLVDWAAYGGTIPGTNGPMQFVFPLDASPGMFFRIGASN